MKAKEISPKKLVVFDIDDTLVHTQTKVHVVKDGEVVDSLNSHDFTHYRLKPGEEFDFSGFRNAREFFEKSKPIIPMMNQLKRDITTGNKVVMVTARADFDDKELFLDTFRKFGIDMSKVHVYRAGNSKEGTTEERKKAIIKRLLDSGNFTKAIMYDDAKPNLHTFMELKRDHPQTKFYAWHVSLEGEASEYMREGLEEKWSAKYKRSINCNNPKGFSQKAHCDGRKKNEEIQWKQGVAEGYTTEKQIMTRIRQILHDRKLSGTESNAGELHRLKQQLKDMQGKQGVSEGIVSERKRRKNKPRWAAYGPGPYGGYGFVGGYSGTGGVSGGDGGGGVGEASYEGNIGMMEVAKFFKIATGAQKKLFKELLAKGKRGLAWKLIQDVTETELKGDEFRENRTADVVFDTGEKKKVRYVPGRKDIVDMIVDYYLKQGLRVVKVNDEEIQWNQGVVEGIDIGQEWMTDTELDQYVPDQLQQQWRELVGYDAEGNVSALWANITGGYEPDVNDPADRANMVKVANKWFAMKRIPNVRFFDVRDVGDELEWLVQIG